MIASLESLNILQSQASKTEEERARNIEIIAGAQEALDTISKKGNVTLEERRSLLQEQINFLNQYRDLPGIEAIFVELAAKRNALTIAGNMGDREKVKNAKELSQEVDVLSGTYRSMDSVTGGLANTQMELVDSLHLEAEAASELIPIYEAVGDALIETSSDMAFAFGAALASGASFGEAMKELAKSAAATTLRVLGERATAEAAVLWAAALVPGGQAGIPGAVAMTAAAAGAFTAAGAVSAFGNGGDFETNGPQLIMVGEKGKERVRIDPQSDSRSSGGDGGIIINISGVVNEDLAVEIGEQINAARGRGIAV